MGDELTNYEADLLGDLTDPEYAAMYVSGALEGEPEEFLMALRYVAEARTITKVAEDSNLNRVSLYKILRESGNPRLHSLRRLLKALGLGLSVVPHERSEDEMNDLPNRAHNLAKQLPNGNEGLWGLNKNELSYSLANIRAGLLETHFKYSTQCFPRARKVHKIPSKTSPNKRNYKRKENA